MALRDLTGQRFGMLTVIERAENSRTGKVKWICKCDCGRIKEKPVFRDSLTSGKTTSCGCKYHISNRFNARSHGMKHTRIYNIWNSMKQRCKRDKNYNNVAVCESWNKFENFMDWAFSNGYSDTLTIDRIDNKKGYSPDNCRWVSYKVQENNRRNNVKITINGTTHTVGEWSEISGVSIATIKYRMKHNWKPEELLVKPNFKTKEKRQNGY